MYLACVSTSTRPSVMLKPLLYEIASGRNKGVDEVCKSQELTDKPDADDYSTPNGVLG